jgi:hypothetical protein
MPATRESIIASADKEWQHWGRSTWNVALKTKRIGHTDDESDAANPFAQYVLEKYCSVGGGSPSISDIADDRYYWSAVGMSAIMKNAGFAKTEFPFAQAHSKFIRHFISARKAKDKGAAFWGYRLTEAGGIPEPGDIIAYSRAKNGSQEKANKLFDAVNSYDSHSDVVVAKRATEIDVIGCNVMDSVTKKTLPITAAGQIVDTQHFWFVVLKRR